MTSFQTKFRIAVCSSVSLVALIAVSPPALSADLPKKAPVYKAKPVPEYGVVTMWMEGGGFWNGGSSVGLYAPVPYGGFFAATGLNATPRQLPGGEGAFGADYKFANSPWHFSFDARYGESTSAAQALTSGFLPGTVASPVTSSALEAAAARQSHLVADLMLGYDIGGTGSNQLQFGVRFADLEASLNSSSSANCVGTGTGTGVGSGTNSICTGTGTATGSGTATLGTVGMAALSANERSQFIGAGPRAAVVGSVPFAEGWGIDYMGGVAALFGERKLSVTGTASSSVALLGFGPTTTLTPFSFVSNGSTTIFNADASVALGYWLTPHAKLSVGVRFDGYWNAFRTVNAAGTIGNANQLYYGPFVRLTGQF
jgi:hypothetical protein